MSKEDSGRLTGLAAPHSLEFEGGPAAVDASPGGGVSPQLALPADGGHGARTYHLPPEFGGDEEYITSNNVSKDVLGSPNHAAALPHGVFGAIAEGVESGSESGESWQVAPPVPSRRAGGTLQVDEGVGTDSDSDDYGVGGRAKEEMTGRSKSRQLVEPVRFEQLGARQSRVIVLCDHTGCRALIMQALLGTEEIAAVVADSAETVVTMVKRAIGDDSEGVFEAVLAHIDTNSADCEAVLMLELLRDESLRLPVLITTHISQSVIPRSLAAAYRMGAVGVLLTTLPTTETKALPSPDTRPREQTHAPRVASGEAVKRKIIQRTKDLVERGRKTQAVADAVDAINDVVSHTHALKAGSAEAMRQEEQRVVRSLEEKAKKEATSKYATRTVKDGVVVRVPSSKYRSVTAVRTSSGRPLPKQQRERNRQRFKAKFQVVRVARVFTDISKNFGPEVEDEKRAAVHKMTKFVEEVEARWLARHTSSRASAAFGSAINVAAFARNAAKGRVSPMRSTAPARTRNALLSPSRRLAGTFRASRLTAALSATGGKRSTGTTTSPARKRNRPSRRSILKGVSSRDAKPDRAPRHSSGGNVAAAHRGDGSGPLKRVATAPLGSRIGLHSRRRSMAKNEMEMAAAAAAAAVGDDTSVASGATRGSPGSVAGGAFMTARGRRRSIITDPDAAVRAQLDADLEAEELALVEGIDWDMGRDILQIDCKVPPNIVAMAKEGKHGQNAGIRVDHIGDVREALNLALRAANLLPESHLGAGMASIEHREAKGRYGVSLGSAPAGKFSARGGAHSKHEKAHGYDMVSRAGHLLLRGYELSQHNNLDGAIALYTRAVLAEPNVSAGYLCRGVALDSQGDYRGALDDFNTALQIKPNSFVGLFNRAVVRCRLGDDKNALRDLDYAVHINPRDADAFRNRGLIHRRMDDFVAAKTDYLRASRIERENKKQALAVSALIPTVKEGLVSTLGNAGGTPGTPSSQGVQPAARPSTTVDRLKAGALQVKVLDSPTGSSDRVGEFKLEDFNTPTKISVAVPARDSAFDAMLSGTTSAPSMNAGDDAVVPAAAQSRRRSRRGSLTAYHETQVDGKTDDSQLSVGIKSTTSFHVSSSGGSPAPKRRSDSTKLSSVVRRAQITARAIEPTRDVEETKPATPAGTDGKPGEVKVDVLDRVFNAPTAVQKALRRAPEARSLQNLKEIGRFMDGLLFFRNFPIDVKAGFCKRIEYSAIDKEGIVCNQGDPSNEFYILMSGMLAARLFVPGAKSSVTVNAMEPGTVFGELGLIRNEPRTVSVVATQPSEVLWMPREDFFSLQLDALFLEELQQRERAIRHTRIFDEWPEAEIAKLAAIARPGVYKRGDALVKQGSAPDRLFILRKGICKVYKAADREGHLENRLKATRLELLRVNMNAVYHHSLRPSAKIHLDARQDASLRPVDVHLRAGRSGKRGSTVLNADGDDFVREIPGTPVASGPRSSAVPTSTSTIPAAALGVQLQTDSEEALAQAVSDAALHASPMNPEETSEGPSIQERYGRHAPAVINPSGTAAKSHGTRKARSQAHRRAAAAISTRSRHNKSPDSKKSRYREALEARRRGDEHEKLAFRARSFREDPFDQFDNSRTRTGRTPTGVAALRHHAAGGVARSLATGKRRVTDFRAATGGSEALLSELVTQGPRSLKERSADFLKRHAPERLQVLRDLGYASDEGDDPATVDAGSDSEDSQPRSIDRPNTAVQPNRRDDAALRAGTTSQSRTRPRATRPRTTGATETRVRTSTASQSPFNRTRWYQDVQSAKLRKVAGDRVSMTVNMRSDIATWQIKRSQVSSLGELVPKAAEFSVTLPPARAEARRKHLLDLERQLEQQLARCRRARARMRRGSMVSMSDADAMDSPTTKMLVCKLFPPSIFGEMVLLDPWNGKNPGSVVADTHVEVLSISKQQLDMSLATASFLTTVRRRTVHYPPENAVLQMANDNSKWDNYKRRLISGMKTTRWPSADEQIVLQEPMEQENTFQ